ncbi:hypothetical protein K1719_009449 [Acacia pycnantha]|nr:hypothetical protein K1719_009449 [Acacia pycnantha]
MNSSIFFRPPYIPNHIPDPLYVRIFDTTLRDGEQSVGVCMNSKQKLKIARQLGKLGVDVIDAGFPTASKDDFDDVKIIAQEVGNNVAMDTAGGGYVPVITGACRCIENDIRSAWEAVKYAKRPRIQMFIPTSDIHMKYKLKKTKEEVLEIARRMVQFAGSLGCHDIGFYAEDATRNTTNPEELFPFDPEIERTILTARRVVRLSHRIDTELDADHSDCVHSVDLSDCASDCASDSISDSLVVSTDIMAEENHHTLKELGKIISS